VSARQAYGLELYWIRKKKRFIDENKIGRNSIVKNVKTFSEYNAKNFA